MPTGYTAALYEGEPQTFEQFALTCARNFGALIEMRDSGLDAEIPDAFEPSPYHAEQLRKATARLAELEAMSVIDCAHSARLAFEGWQKAQADRKADDTGRIERYQAMLAQVLQWTPPTDEHTGLRDFMVQQLEESIRFDAPLRDGWDPAPPKEGIAWRESQIAKALRDISYNAEQLAADRERATERTAWLRELRRSLHRESVSA